MIKLNITPFNLINISDYINNGILIGILGARLMAVLTLPGLTLKDFPTIWKGGLCYMGAVVSIISYIKYISMSDNIDYKILLDCAALICPVFNILVRIGNHYNNEMKGKINCISLVESLMHGVVVGGLVWSYVFIDKYKAGRLFNIYMKSYGIVRFCTEFLRSEELKYPLEYDFNEFTIWQVSSIVMIYPPSILLFADQYWKQNTKSLVVHNKGFSFDIKPPYMMGIHTTMIAYLLYNYNSVNNLILMGSLSNYVDRMVFGYVRDHIPIFNFRCNLSDIMINIGMLQIIGEKLINI